jgi:site-specific recombinase XerD
MDTETARLFGKGRRSRLVSFGVETGRALDRYLRIRRQHKDARRSPSLWLGRRGPLTDQGLRLAIRRRGEQAGLGRIHPHMTRHSAAHKWLSLNGSESGLMQHMGWRDAGMLRRYANSTREERAIEEHKRLAPGDRA